MTTKPPQPIEWTAIRSLLEDEQEFAAIDAMFPDVGKLSFLNALGQVDPAQAGEIQSAGRRLLLAGKLAEFPVLAVAGMLNSGKTSLVASFLSDDGRARTLRGESNQAGTHRFVLWLPERWRGDAELWGLMMSRLTEALGQPPEMLSSDVEQAHRQYNNALSDTELLGIPLVATDPKLDEINVGLLDCPDIVTSEAFGRGAVDVRKSLLARAATLCSGFVIVADYASIRANTIGEILEVAARTMPDVDRMLAVNMIRPKYLPHEVYQDLQPLVQSGGIVTSFLAYDFEIPGSEAFIPKAADRGAEDDPIPVFFEAPESKWTKVKRMDSSKLLQALPSRLNRSELFEGYRRSQQKSLARLVWTQAITGLRSRIEQQAGQAERIRQTLRDASLEFFARRDFATGKISELRLHQSVQIVNQLTEAFTQTAPWYARMSMRINGRVSRWTRSATDAIRNLNVLGSARETAQQVRDQLRSGKHGAMLTGERLHDEYIRYDISGLLGIAWNDPKLREICDTVVERFQREDSTALDESQLHETARQMWKELSMMKKLRHGITPLAALTASFAAVLMVPLDGGSTLVLMHASVGELLIATGFTGLVTAWNGHGTLKTMEMRAALQQLADFIALQCDSLGVPRPANQPGQTLAVQVASTRETLPQAKIANCAGQLTAVRLWKLRAPFLEELSRRLPMDS